MEPVEIRANFKQATVKGGTAVLQLEILTSDANAFPILKLSGKPVVLTVADIQDELPLDYDEDEGEPLPFDDRRTWTPRRARYTRSSRTRRE